MLTNIVLNIYDYAYTQTFVSRNLGQRSFFLHHVTISTENKISQWDIYMNIPFHSRFMEHYDKHVRKKVRARAWREEL